MIRRLGAPLLRGFLSVMLLHACGVPVAPSSRFLKALDSPNDWLYVRIPSHRITQRFIDLTGWERDHKRDDFYAFGYLQRASLELLPSQWQSEIKALEADDYIHHEFDAKTLALSPWEETNQHMGYEDYHNYEDLTRELKSIDAAHSEIASLSSIGLSTEKRNLWMFEISGKNQSDEGLPKLLYVANMHGDEVVGRELMIYLIRHLTEKYGSDSRITHLVDHARIFIVPTLNPDGFEKKQRHNASSVDLNRNFPDFTSDNRDSPEARAPETQAIMSLHQKHHFILAANFHGGEVCFNIPWDTTYNDRLDQRFGDDLLMRRLARQYADANKTMRANSGGSFDRGVTYGFEWYEINGGMQDWSIHYRGSIHGTVELSYAKWPPASQLPRFWDENREAMVTYLEQGLYGMHLRIVDEDQNLIPGASIKIGSLARHLTYPTGKVHRPALAGSQSVRVDAKGYRTAEMTVEPGFFSGTYQDFTLLKSPAKD